MDGDARLPYDPVRWHNVQTPEEMDLSRRYEYDEDHLCLLRKWLRLDEGPAKIVEVGCGSGFFTEKLVEMAPGSEVIGVEPDEVLRAHAEGKGLPRTRLVKGTAESIPLPSGFSDLTTCHIVLNNLPDIPRAVSEMTRVTKRGGIVAAIEPHGGGVSYHPDPRLNDLRKKARIAFGKGVWEPRRRTIDYSKVPEDVRARYPEVFRSCGLEDVEVHGLLSVFLLSDPRSDRDEILEWLKEKLDFLIVDEERSRVILARGGLEEPLIEESLRLNREHLRRLIEDPELISKTHELESVGRIVTVGFRPGQD